MTEALIKPHMLRWARERVGLEQEAPAKKAGRKPEQILHWEEGASRPTFRQAQKLARILHVPFGYLYLSNPPNEGTPIPDLRTIGDTDVPDLSVDFIDVVNDALRKQDWYRDYLREEGAEKLDFVGRYGLDDPVEEVAESIRTTLCVDDESRRKMKNWKDFLQHLTARAEEVGILVLRNGIVGNNTRRPLSAEEFRGFAICDNLAPVIFINGSDWKTSQVFTLAHELAHLWIGEPGVSNPDLEKSETHSDPRIERFCNRVAAEFLTPRDVFLSKWNEYDSGDRIQRLVRHFRVSSAVILRRAFDLKKIEWDEFERESKTERKKFEDRERNRKEEGKGGGDTHKSIPIRNSPTFTRAAISAAHEGRLLFREAASLLGLKKVGALEGIAEKLGIH